MLIFTGVLVSFLMPSCEKGLPADSAGLSCSVDDEACGGSTVGDDGAGEAGPEPPPSLARRLLRIWPY
jgi:hypothetical protein